MLLHKGSFYIKRYLLDICVINKTTVNPTTSCHNTLAGATNVNTLNNIAVVELNTTALNLVHLFCNKLYKTNGTANEKIGIYLNSKDILIRDKQRTATVKPTDIAVVLPI